MQGPENITSLARVSSIDLPDQLTIKISSPVSRELGLREGQFVRGAVAEDGQSITFGSGSDAQSYSAALSPFKGQKYSFQFLKNTKGMFLKADSAEKNSPKPSESTGKQNSVTQGSPSRLSMLLSQSNSYRHISILNSGARLAEVLEKRTGGIGKNLSDIVSMKASSISAQNVKDSLAVSGLLGSLVSSKSPKLAGVKELAQELRILKKDASARGQNLGTLQEDIDSSIDYLDSNKISLLQAKAPKTQGYRFLMTFGDFPSVEVILKELEEVESNFSSEEAYSPQRTTESKVTSYQSILNDAEISESLEENSTDAEMDDRETADRNTPEDDEKRNTNSDSPVKSSRQIELDFQFSETDKIAIKMSLNDRLQANAVLWASNKATLNWAISNQDLLSMSLSKIGVDLDACQFLEGERPARADDRAIAKNNFVVEI